MIPEITPCLEGFDSIPRKWNTKLGHYIANVIPGEFYITKTDEGIMTTLGSCISCCVRDRISGVGGLNHFMLPSSESTRPSSSSQKSSDFGKAGDWAMEFLMNGILMNGGKRSNLEAKLFGGAQMLPGLQNASIGKRNIEFINAYMNREQIPIVSSDLGGEPPRKILYFPKTGQVKLKRLPIAKSRRIVEEEKSYGGSLVTHDSHAGEIDLF